MIEFFGYDVNEVREMEKTEKHSTIKELIYLYKEIILFDKKLIFYTLAAGVAEMLIPLASLGLTAVIIDAASQQRRVDELIINFSLILLVVASCTIISKTSTVKIDNLGNIFRVSLLYRTNEKLTKVDYDLFDGNKGQEVINKAMKTLMNPSDGIQEIFKISKQLIMNIVGIIVYSYVLGQVHWMFILLVLLSSILNYIYGRRVNKVEDQNKSILTPIDRKIWYLKEETGKFNRAKDMRLYNMNHWFSEIFKELSNQKYTIFERVVRIKLLGNILSAVFSVGIDLIAYVYLINLIINGSIGVASFTIYFGAIAITSRWIGGLLNSGLEFHKMSLYVRDYRSFIETESKSDNRKDGIRTVTKEAKTIEFKAVSYRYPEAKKDTIQDFNLSIRPGEKIALVGINGAGKSTLVKLLTGLYTPQTGSILIDGEKMENFTSEAYYDLFSVVFQDYYELPVTIEEMILQGKEKNISKLKEVNKQSGMDRILEGFEGKEQTKLVKRVYADAVDLSGGQKQKLQLAKALYKDGPILILDEPTAALDPIAENEIYQQYEELTKGKTSFFISHRLSSTRFCDRIVYLENGKILEDGTHRQLMQKKGKYYEMYETQSYYYKEKVGEADVQAV